jgi:hypothetical protein
MVISVYSFQVRGFLGVSWHALLTANWHFRIAPSFVAAVG